MDLDNKIHKTKREIHFKKVTLTELSIALDVIDHQIVKLRSEIESYGEYLKVLEDERRRQ